MRRREFITLFGSAAASWPLAARAQQSMPRLGILMQGSSELSTNSLDPFYQGMRELGYIEGQNIAIERRFGPIDRLPELAAELVGLKVDLIYAWSTPAARAAKHATNTIPIVAAIMADPLGDELVASLARPGGNVTGTTFLVALVAKRLQMLKETLPKFSRLAALWHADAGYSGRTMEAILKETKLAADTLGLQLQLVQVLRPDDFEGAFSAMIREHADALIVSPSPMLFLQRKRIVDLALKSRLPAVYTVREYVEAGGLMCYGANLADMTRRTASYVDRILKGAKPTELPVEQPSKFELVINLKTAKALDLTIPPLLLALADEVIE